LRHKAWMEHTLSHCEITASWVYLFSFLGARHSFCTNCRYHIHLYHSSSQKLVSSDMRIFKVTISIIHHLNACTSTALTYSKLDLRRWLEITSLIQNGWEWRLVDPFRLPTPSASTPQSHRYVRIKVSRSAYSHSKPLDSVMFLSIS
jgi:hypothetical protein